MRSITTRYALRSLSRNPRRTLLSVVGVAFGVGVGLLSMAIVEGEQSMFLSSAGTGGIGHLRLAPRGWRESHSLDARLEDWQTQLRVVRATPGVAAASPRAEVRGLLGLGTRSAPVLLTGVDPSSEPRTLRYIRALSEGRYLEPADDGAVVLGRSIVSRLRAELDDELLVSAVDSDGEVQSRLIVLVGIIDTGSRTVDDTIAHVQLADVESLSGRTGAGHVAVLLDDVHALEPVAAELRQRLADEDADEDEVLTWLDVSPEMRAGMAEGDGYTTAMLVILLMVVLMGVMSAQLTGVLHRRKEFAVLAALGMRSHHLVIGLLTEGLILGALGAAGALAWSAPVVLWLSEEGISLGAMMGAASGEEMALGSVLMEGSFYPSFGLWLVAAGFGLSLFATLAASVYPAAYAARTEPAAALRVDR